MFVNYLLFTELVGSLILIYEEADVICSIEEDLIFET